MLTKILNLGDWVNPILIKEVRQKTRSHFYHFVSFGILFLSYFVVATAVLSSFAASKKSLDGEGLFIFFALFLSLGCLLALPFRAFQGMKQEKDGQTFDLLSLSGLSPRNILNGKLQSIFLDLFLFFTLTSPYLLFCFLLGGTGIEQLLDFLLMIFLGSLLFSMTATAGSAGDDRFIQGGRILLFPMFFGMGISFVSTLISFSSSHSQGLISIAQKEPLFFLGLLIAYGTLIHLLYQFILAQLMYENDEKTSQIKKGIVYFLMAIWYLGFQKGSGGIFSSTLFTLSITPLIGLFFVTEGVLLTQRQLFLYPNSLWGRFYAFIFFPGKIRGYTFFSFLVALQLIPIALANQLLGSPGMGKIGIDKVFFDTPFICFSFYLILGMGLCRYMPKKFQTRFHRTTAIFIFSALGVICSSLFCEVTRIRARDSFFMLLVPWEANFGNHPEYIIPFLVIFLFPFLEVIKDFRKTVLEKGNPNGD